MVTSSGQVVKNKTQEAIFAGPLVAFAGVTNLFQEGSLYYLLIPV